MFPTTFQHGIRDCPFYAPAFRRTSLVEVFCRENCDHHARPACDCVSKEPTEMSTWIRKDIEADKRNHDGDGRYAQRVLMNKAMLVRLMGHFEAPGIIHDRARLFLSTLRLILMRQLISGLIWGHSRSPSRNRRGTYLCE